MRAAIYARISRDDGTERGLGVARQEADCRTLAAERGWEVAQVFTDNDKSAYSGRPRPQYLAMLAAMERGEIGAVVAWHPDRLQRSPRELEDFIDAVEAAGVEVATVRAGVVDLSTAAGRMTARVVGAVARHESEQKSERQRRKARELAEAGKLGGGGWRPFGFEDDFVTVRAAEAAVIREAARMVLAGRTLYAVITAMEADGHLTTTGKHWSTTTLRRMLTSPRIAGLRQHRGEIVGEAVWPAIIDPAELHALRRLLLDPGRDKRAGSRRYLLSGLLVCGVCGMKLVARPRADKRKSMVCAKGGAFHGCGRTQSLCEPMDEMVVTALLAKVDDQNLRRASTGLERVDPGPARAEVRRLGLLLDELALERSAGTLDARSWRTAREDAEKRLRAAEAVLEEDPAARVLAGVPADLRAAWPGLAVDQQRAIAATHIEAVVISPAVKGRTAFDPGRFTIRWR